MKNLTLHLNRYTFLKKMSVLTTATILAGCSMAPIYERPVSPVLEHYPTGEAYPGLESEQWKAKQSQPILAGVTFIPRIMFLTPTSWIMRS